MQPAGGYRIAPGHPPRIPPRSAWWRILAALERGTFEQLEARRRWRTGKAERRPSRRPAWVVRSLAAFLLALAGLLTRLPAFPVQDKIVVVCGAIPGPDGRFAFATAVPLELAGDPALVRRKQREACRAALAAWRGGGTSMASVDAAP